MFITLIEVVCELSGQRFSSGSASVNDNTLNNYSGHPAPLCERRCDKDSTSSQFICENVCAGATATVMREPAIDYLQLRASSTHCSQHLSKANKQARDSCMVNTFICILHAAVSSSHPPIFVFIKYFISSVFCRYCIFFLLLLIIAEAPSHLAQTKSMGNILTLKLRKLNLNLIK